MKLNYTSESELVRAFEEYRREKEQYNGWTNYATWRVNLEMVDSNSWREKKEDGFTYETIGELADAIKWDCELYLGDEAGGYAEGLNHDYAMAFLSDVNWYQIAEYIAEDIDGIVVKKD